MLHSFTPMEYKAATTSLKLRAASGPDLITNKIITQFPEEVHTLILKIFNLIFHKSVFPNKWNDYFVIFIPKPGNKEEP